MEILGMPRDHYRGKSEFCTRGNVFGHSGTKNIYTGMLKVWSYIYLFRICFV